MGHLTENMSVAEFETTLVFGSEKRNVRFRKDQTVRHLRSTLTDLFNVSKENQTRIVYKGADLAALQQDDATLEAVGLNNRSKVLLIGTEDGQRDSFLREEKAIARRDQARDNARERQRRRRGGNIIKLSGVQPDEYTFTEISPLENLPPGVPGPYEAESLLRRLANDRGIRAIMQEHKWTVHRLTEFAPSLSTGIVGVTDSCLLGYNKNKGQEISLRLRTDDFEGFRYYNIIVETLIHELCHMEHSDHDAAFWRLNSQLTKEYKTLDWQASTGRYAVGGGTATSVAWADHDAAARAGSAALTRAAKQRNSASTLGADDIEHADAQTSTTMAHGGRTTGVGDEPSPEAPDVLLHPQGSGPREVSGSASAGAALLEPCAASVDTTAASSGCTAAIEDADTSTVPHSADSLAQKASPDSAGAAGTGTAPVERRGIPSGLQLFPLLKGSPKTDDAMLLALVATLEELPPACRWMDTLATCLGTLGKIVRNIRLHPDASKYKQLQLSNARVHQFVGVHPPALRFLEQIGFTRDSDVESQTLRYVRNDVGLLWLAGDLLEAALREVENSEHN
eukprot:m.1463190 g.1463190  ORF g.1463190 m.1463190 type:complete len:567 (+) comp25134_c0_seq52:212-1912(+)